MSTLLKNKTINRVYVNTVKMWKLILLRGILAAI